MKRYLLEGVVFVSGAVIMILEIVGSRVLGPYVGTSLFVWTSLIGIILGSLSLGYWLGGALADRQLSYKILSRIIFASGLFIGITTVSSTPILSLLQNGIHDIRIEALIATLLLFAPPNTFLGMISPYAIKLKMKHINTSGITVGRLYAISTTGSIFGTFLAGFILLSYMGSRNILFLLSITLILTSLFVYTKSIPKYIIGMLLILVFIVISILFEPKGVIDIDTDYNRVFVFDTIDTITKRPIRLMRINSEVHSAMYKNSDELALSYTKFFRLAKHFNPDIAYILMIGGGGYSYPKDFLRDNLYAKLDVVEIDPKVTRLAQQYFGLKENSRLTIYHQDGRVFLNTVTTHYDAIVTDVFRSFFSIPYHLSTLETVQKMYQILHPGGVVVLNIVSSIEGESGLFLRAEYLTYKRVFPYVYLFPVEDFKDGGKIQNIILVALKSENQPKLESDNSELNGYLKNQWKKEIQKDVPILTDDYAPVDQYIVKLFQ